MTKILIQVPAEVQKVETMANGIKIVVLTNEMQPDHMAVLFRLIDKQGWFLFKESEIKPEDVQDLPEVETEKGQKTPSQRLRAVIHVYWQQSGGMQRKDGRTSEEYYKFYMEKLINSIKDKLN